MAEDRTSHTVLIRFVDNDLRLETWVQAGGGVVLWDGGRIWGDLEGKNAANYRRGTGGRKSVKTAAYSIEKTEKGDL